MAKKKKAYKNWFNWFETPQGISIIIFIFVFILFVSYAKSYDAKQTPTGDEPHYIIAAQSLIKDHDIDLANNYKNQDYWDYFPGEIDPHIALKSVHGETNPMHGVGLSILLIPFYLIKGRLGTIIFANLIGALLAANIFLLLWERTKNKVLSVTLSLIGIFSIPLSIYSFQVFPELLAALIIIYAFRKLPDSFWPILPLAFLPWIHYKYFPIVLIFMVILIIKKRYYYLIPLILSLIGLLFFNQYFYGSFKPYVPFGTGVLTLGFLGIFIDRENGLLAWSPFFIFFFFAVASWWKNDSLSREKKWVWLAIILALILPVTFFTYWQGGWSPMPRYTVPLIPLLLLPIAYLLNKFNKDFFTILFFSILAGISLLISGLGLSSPILLYSNGLSIWTKIGLINFLPSFPRASIRDWLLFFILLVFTLIMALYYNYRLEKTKSF